MAMGPLAVWVRLVHLVSLGVQLVKLIILDYTDKEREILAERSLNYVCEQCGKTADLLLPVDDEAENSGVKSEIDKYAKEVTISRPAATAAASANNNG